MKLTHPIRIESAAEITTASGATRIDWANPQMVGRRRAQIETGDSRTVTRARMQVPELAAVITIRGRIAVTPKMRVVHEVDGRKWDILGVETVDGKSAEHADWIRLNCMQGLAAGA